MFDYWLHHQHSHLKEKTRVLSYKDLKIFFVREFNPSEPLIGTLICIYGSWWERRLVFEDKLVYKAQNDNLYLTSDCLTSLH